MTRYVFAWIAMLVIAVGNGALRQATFGKGLSELHAHQVSSFIGALFEGAFIWLVVRVWPPASSRHALRIGGLWLGLTVLFETFMGTVLLKRSLSQVLSDYNLLVGRVWVLFLLWIMLAPWLFFRLSRTTRTPVDSTPTHGAA